LSATLRPGDSIVVPEKTPKIGGTNWTAIMQTAQVASSVALAVAYIRHEDRLRRDKGEVKVVPK